MHSKMKLLASGVFTAALVAVSVALPAQPANAAEFTARVAATAHNANTVTIVGTGDAGHRVDIDSSDGSATDTRVRTDNSWRATLQLESKGRQTVTVREQSTSSEIRLTAATRSVSRGPVLYVRDQWARAVTVNAYPGWEPRARVSIELDGRLVATTRVQNDGTFAHRVEGVGFGQHRIVLIERFDGAEQARDTASLSMVGNPTIDATNVRHTDRVIHVSGRGPANTRLRFTDPTGTPYVLKNGTDWTENTDGSWSAELRYPTGAPRLVSIIAEVWEKNVRVGTASTTALIPFDLSATVSSYRPDLLVLSGNGEPGSRLSFAAADGNPIFDSDGNTVDILVPGKGGWTKSIDPRLFTGGTVTVLATSSSGSNVGKTTVTFR